MAGSPVTESPREMIARILPEEFTEARLRELIRSAFDLTQGIYVADGECPGCGRARQVKARIPDLRAIIATLTEWVEQGYGRPGTAQAEQGDVVLVVERMWPLAEDPDPDVVRPAQDQIAGGVPPIEG